MSKTVRFKLDGAEHKYLATVVNMVNRYTGEQTSLDRFAKAAIMEAADAVTQQIREAAEKVKQQQLEKERDSGTTNRTETEQAESTDTEEHVSVSELSELQGTETE